MLKRVLSILLVFALVFGVPTGAAFADVGDDIGGEIDKYMDEETEEDDEIIDEDEEELDAEEELDDELPLIDDEELLATETDVPERSSRAERVVAFSSGVTVSIGTEMNAPGSGVGLPVTISNYDGPNIMTGGLLFDIPSGLELDHDDPFTAPSGLIVPLVTTTTDTVFVQLQAVSSLNGYNYAANGGLLGTLNLIIDGGAPMGDDLIVSFLDTEGGGAQTMITNRTPAIVPVDNWLPGYVEVGSATLEGAIRIDGEPVYGETLTAVVRTSLNGPFEYQWLRDGSDIGGEDSAEYELTHLDIGRDISVRVQTDTPLTEGHIATSTDVTVLQRQLTWDTNGTVNATRGYNATKAANVTNPPDIAGRHQQ